MNINILLQKYFSKYFLNKIKILLVKARLSKYVIKGFAEELDAYLPFTDGYFVELGANDGVSQSNSLNLEIRKNWRGVLVEPSPNNFLQCRKLRRKENYYFCNACVGFDYTERFVEMVYADLMTVGSSVAPDLPDASSHLNSAQQFISDGECMFSFGAVARPLSDLLGEAGAPSRINFMSIDVEGAEMSVLRGIDFEQYTFDYILIEARSFSSVNNFLVSKGFVFEKSFSEKDFLFRCID